MKQCFRILLGLAALGLACLSAAVRGGELVAPEVPDPEAWAAARVDFVRGKLKANPDFLDADSSFYKQLIEPAQTQWFANHGYAYPVRVHRGRETPIKGSYIKDGFTFRDIRASSRTIPLDGRGNPITDWVVEKEDRVTVSGARGAGRDTLIHIAGAPARLVEGVMINQDALKALNDQKQALQRKHFLTTGSDGKPKSRVFKDAEARQKVQRAYNEEARALHLKFVWGNYDPNEGMYASLRLSHFSRYGSFMAAYKGPDDNARALLLAEAESLMAHVASYVDVADAYLRAECGLPPRETEEEEEDDQLFGLVLTASAAHHEEAREEVFCPDFTPARVHVTGLVRDDGGRPVANAKVQLANPATAVTTDKEGKYALIGDTGHEGDKTWNVTINATLDRVVNGLQFTVDIPDEPLIANGSKQQMILTVTDENGKPLRNRDVTVFAPVEWTGPGERTVDYLAFPSGFEQYVRTDEQGKIAYDFLTPAVLTQKVGTLAGTTGMDRVIFPVEGTLRVIDKKSRHAAEDTYTLESPYPRVSKLSIIDVDAGTWQSRGSTLELRDHDSDHFIVEIKIFGRLKVPGGEVYRNGLYHELDGKTFTFYYHPNLIGEDLNAQPGDLWKEFAEMNLQLVAKYMIDISGSYMLAGMGVTGGNLYDNAKKTWGAVETMDKIDTLRTDMEYPSEKAPSRGDMEQKAVQVTDIVIGCVEATPGLADVPLTGGGTFGEMALGVSKYNVPLEVAKVVLENAKLMLKFHRQFEAINDMYQNTLFMPIVVTVTDPEGHRISILRNVSVRAWKK